MKLTKSQLNDIIEQYVEIIVDNMDIKLMQEFITETMQDSLCKLGQEELE